MSRIYFSINMAPFLMTAGFFTVIAALLHLACIAGGADWYRFMGAGEPMARAVEQGRWFPHLITVVIATALLVAAAFAFSGSAAVDQGIGTRLPFTRTALITISAVFLARGLLIFAPSVWRPDLTPNFKFWSSGIVLILGLLYAVGTIQAWRPLGAKVEQI